jgi:Tol biopolymer transport system component
MLRRVSISAVFALSLIPGASQGAAKADDSPDQMLAATRLVSESVKGGTGNGISKHTSTDRSGRYVAFASRASDLIDGNREHGRDVFVYDRSRHKITVISRRRDGRFPNGPSERPDMSGNGQWVAYASRASNLVDRDENGRSDVFVSNRSTGKTKLVSKARGGGTGKRASTSAAVDDGGHRIAFGSLASNLVRHDHNHTGDVFLFHRRTGRTTLVSAALTGGAANGRSFDPAISGNGRFVAYTSVATDLVEGATAHHGDVFLFDRRNGTNMLVSRAISGGPGNNVSTTPSISHNGRYIAFASFASDLVAGDSNGTWDVFRYDRVSGAMELVSRSTSGGSGNSGSFTPAIDDHGAIVAFASDATNLGPVDTNQRRDVYVRNLARGKTRLMSANADGEAGNASSGRPSVSGDGSYVTFESAASDLVRPDRNKTWDVFLRRRG